MRYLDPKQRLMKPRLGLAILALGMWTGSVRPHALAAEQPRHLTPPTPGQFAAQQYFTDVILVNQNGQKLRLYSDLLKGKVVVIHSFFATCQGSCPVAAATFLKLQQHFGDRLGKELSFLSVSVDPERDTPTALKAYAQRFQVRPGWHLLSGKKENVDWALYKLGQYVEVKESHSNVILIGNMRTGLWKKVMGVASYDVIVQTVESVLADRG